MPMEIEPAQTLFREQSGDDNQAQHRCQQEVEQIVSGVDGCHPDTKAKEEEACALGGQTN
jgi:hypothetical protein